MLNQFREYLLQKGTTKSYHVPYYLKRVGALVLYSIIGLPPRIVPVFKLLTYYLRQRRLIVSVFNLDLTTAQKVQPLKAYPLRYPAARGGRLLS